MTDFYSIAQIVKIRIPHIQAPVAIVLALCNHPHWVTWFDYGNWRPTSVAVRAQTGTSDAIRQHFTWSNPSGLVNSELRAQKIGTGGSRMPEAVRTASNSGVDLVEVRPLGDAYRTIGASSSVEPNPDANIGTSSWRLSDKIYGPHWRG